MDIGDASKIVAAYGVSYIDTARRNTLMVRPDMPPLVPGFSSRAYALYFAILAILDIIRHNITPILVDHMILTRDFGIADAASLLAIIHITSHIISVEVITARLG